MLIFCIVVVGGIIFLKLFGDEFGIHTQGYPLYYDLPLGEQADVRFTYECPTRQDYGEGSPSRFGVHSSYIPPGMHESPGGLTGTPTETGEWYIRVSVTCDYKSLYDGSWWYNRPPYETGAKIRVHLRR